MIQFEVIPGGLLHKDDLWSPPGSASEWTEEEREEFDRFCYEQAEPGSVEAAVKNAPITTEEISTTIKSLEALRTACAAEAEKGGVRDEWPHLEVDYLYAILKQRQQAEAV